MDEQAKATATSKALDPEQLHAILTRLVSRVCPYWLAGERDDLVQNAALRIMNRSAPAEENEALGTSYLWRVAHSVVMDEIRRRRRHPEVQLQTSVGSVAAAASPGPEGSGMGREVQAAITAGLAGLGGDRRWAVLLYLYGFSLKDSARLLGWQAKRMDNQRYKGLRELRAYLQERGFEP